MSSSLSIKSRIFIKQPKFYLTAILLEEKEEYAKGKEPNCAFNSKSNCFPFGNAEKKLVDFLNLNFFKANLEFAFLLS